MSIARKALGVAKQMHANRKAADKCIARSRSGNRLCNNPIRYPGEPVCRKEICQLWLFSHDEEATAELLKRS